MKQQTDVKESIEHYSAEKMRSIIADPSERKWLNERYNSLSFSQKEIFHTKFSKIFRNENYTGESGTWKIKFGGKDILLPLNADRIWLDWDSALSIVGHDVDVKETYLNVINAANPDLFIDIGANYGTHSLLFLSQGIETLTFEPNTACLAVFKEMCRLNNVSPRVKAAALGQKQERVTLTYPEERTWFGSTNKDVATELSDEHDVVKDSVLQKPLDAYLTLIEGKDSLIKIDTEGNEPAVLEGAEKVLKEVEPMIIFESFGEGERENLYTFLNNNSYKIYNLPWHPKENKSALTHRTFMDQNASNFIAVV